MRTALKIAALLVAILMIVPVLVLVLAVGTERGTRSAFELARGSLPDGIGVGRIEGRLADRIVLHDVAADLDGIELEVARLELHWAPAALLGGRLVVHELLAAEVRVALSPAEEARPSDPAAPFTLPERVDLPVAVQLGRAAVSDARILLAPDAEPVVVDTLEIAGTFVDARLEVERLELRSPLLDLQAAASLTAAGDYALQARLDWTLRIDPYPSLQGATRLDGTLAALDVDQALAAPYNTQATARLEHLLEGADRLQVTATAEVRELDPTLFQPDLPLSSVTLDLRAAGSLDALELHAELAAEGLEQGRVDAVAAARVQPEAVIIHELTFTQPTHDGRFDASGRIGLEEAAEADLRIVWQRLRWPLDGEPLASSPQGELRLTGPPDDYRFSLAADLQAAGQPPVALELSGEGGLESAAADLRASMSASRLAGRAEVGWTPSLEARVALEGEDVDLGAFAADWPGRLRFELAAEGRIEEEVISVRIERLSAAGDMRGQALAVEARGAYRQDAAAAAVHAGDIESLSLRWGDTRLNADGRVAETADLRWRLDAPDLSALVDGARGRLSGTGSITGALPLPHVQAVLDGTNLGYAEHELERLALSADVDPSTGSTSSLRFDAERGVLAGIEVESLNVEGTGVPGAHRLSARLRSSSGDADVALEGSVAEPVSASSEWQFVLTDGRLVYPELAPWSLREPAEGRVSRDWIGVDRHCWVSDDAHLCIGAESRPESLDVELDLQQLELAYLAPFLPDGYTLVGVISAVASLQQRDGEGPSGRLELTTDGGELVLNPAGGGGPSAPTAVDRVRFETSYARVTLLPEEASADVDFTTEHGRLRLDARLPDLNAAADTPLIERDLTAALSIDVPDVAFLAVVVPDLTELAGRVTGRIDAAGSIAAPVLTGGIRLEEGSAAVSSAGITLTDMSMDLTGQAGGGVALSASASSGGGSVSLSGELALFSEVPTASLQIRGDGFQIARTRDAEIYVSPRLEIRADAERIDLSGDVLIPRADITPRSEPASAVTASSDQILLQDEPAEELPGGARDLYARVRIVLGDEVHFDGYGLTGRFEGNVLAVQEPAAPTTATGEISIIDGEYRAYGQGLVIEAGNVYFAGGPLTQPALDIRAVRRPQPGILVGAHVVGTLEEPEFTLFSEPPMSEQEQLSYLVLGRSLQEAPDGESSFLAQAALSMGLRGGDFLARNIGERIGIDNLAIETGSGEAGAASDPSQAALVAGTYLSPRLYVSYGIGLFNTVNVLRVQYSISNRWRIETQSSSEAAGADVIYTIERGQ